jgi:hypothetical protein
MKECRACGRMFSPPQSPQGRAMKYCSEECRRRGYALRRREAKRRYRRRNPRGVVPVVQSCRWCGSSFLSRGGRLYCSDECRGFARREQVLLAVQRYRVCHPKSEQQRYFDNLGNSNLRGHRHDDFDDESRLVRAEKRRLHI